MAFSTVMRCVFATVLGANLLLQAGYLQAAATMSASATAPTVGADDIAQLVGTSDIGGDAGHIWSNRPVQGQSFLTGSSAGGYLLTAVTFQNYNNETTSATFTIRIGGISGNVFTTVRTEVAANTVSYVPGDYITATLTTPIWLMPDQLCGVDWGSSGSGFVTANNWDSAGDAYTDGAAYSSGTSSTPGATLTFHAADRAFHLDMDTSSFMWSGGGTTADFSDGANWADGVAPTSDSTTSVLISGDVNLGSSSAPINQDVGTPMVLNRLYVAGYSNGGDDVVLGGGALQFETDGTTTPTIIANRLQAVTIQNDLVAAADLTMNVYDADGDLVIEGQISGDGAITKIENGTLVLAGGNTYTGTTTISAGVLQVGDGGTTGSLGTGSVVNNSSLVFNRSNDFTVSNSISGSGTVTKSGAGTVTLASSNSTSGSITVAEGTLNVAAAITNASSITVSPGAVLRFSGTNLITSSHGTAESASSYVTVDGGTWISDAGVCRIGNVNLLNGAIWEANVTNEDWGNFYLGALSDGSDATVTVGGTAASQIKGSGNIKLGTNTQFNVADVTGDSNADLTASVRLDNQTNDQGSAAGGFTKLGAGTMVLSGATNTYTGITTVQEGTLQINGAIDGAVIIDGGTLGGTGTIGGVVTVNSGGTHAPGASVGSQVAGGATWNAGGTFQFEINDALGTAGGPTGWDLLTLTDGSGTATLDLTALSASSPFTIEIVSLSGTTAGEIANFVATQPCEWEFLTYQQLSGAFSRDLFVLDASRFANDTGVGYFNIVQTTSGLAIAFVPEPGTIALTLTAFALLLIRRRRK